MLTPIKLDFFLILFRGCTSVCNIYCSVLSCSTVNLKFKTPPEWDSKSVMPFSVLLGIKNSGAQKAPLDWMTQPKIGWHSCTDTLFLCPQKTPSVALLLLLLLFFFSWSLRSREQKSVAHWSDIFFCHKIYTNIILRFDLSFLKLYT